MAICSGTELGNRTGEVDIRDAEMIRLGNAGCTVLLTVLLISVMYYCRVSRKLEWIDNCFVFSGGVGGGRGLKGLYSCSKVAWGLCVHKVAFDQCRLN